MPDEFTLFDPCTNLVAMRVRIALKLKGINYNRKLKKPDKNLLPPPMKPFHWKTPVLVHNKKPILGSLIQVQYVDALSKTNPLLLPSDPYAKAQALFWADYVDKEKIFDLGHKICYTKGKEQEAAKKKFIKCFKELEAELGNKPFFGGLNLGYVDVVLVPCCSYFLTYEQCGKFRIEVECPKIFAWAKKCRANQSVSNTLPNQGQVYDYVVKKRKEKFGSE